MKKLILSFLGCVAGTVAAAYVLPGVHAVGLAAALLAGVALGVAYLLLRPLAKLLAFPLAIITLGLLYVLLDAGILWIVTQSVAGFEIDSFGWAIVASVVINLIRRMFRSAAK